MTIDYTALKNRRFEPIRHTYTERDAMFYALAIGVGSDPTDERELGFVYEPGLKAFPTLAVILAYPGFWMQAADSGIDWVRVVHGEERVRWHAPIAPAGTVVSTHRVAHVIDKGRDRGALVVIEKQLSDAVSGTLLATVEHVTFCRGDGGYARTPADSDVGLVPLAATPEGAPDSVCELPTIKQAALFYRLCADMNPLHADPAVARAAGYPAPILHGLASYGTVAHAVLRTYCGYTPSALRSFSARFSAPVYPGETIRTEMWRDGTRVRFRARVVERDVLVLSHGLAELAA